jgi:hypothetical protein
MTEQQTDLTPEELDEQEARELPDREEMSVVQFDHIVAPTPVDPTVPIASQHAGT